VLWESALILRIAQFGIPAKMKVGAIIRFAPLIAVWAFSVTVMACVASALLIRFVVSPLYLKWLRPPVDDSGVSFHLDVREGIIESVPARFRRDRLWRAGTLLRTDRRICFLPSAWDNEPLYLPADKVESVSLVEPPPLFWGFVRDLPMLLMVRTKEGVEYSFAVAEPAHVRHAFCPVESGLVAWIP
jgi:hypothetical protein